MIQLKQIVVFSLPPSLAAAALLFGAVHRVDPEPKAGVPFWSGDTFATLAWTGAVVLLAGVALGWKRVSKDPDAMAFAGLGGQLLLVSAGITIVMAVAAECQNYWDAYHFSSLAWTFALAAWLSLMATLKALHAGSKVAQALKLPAIASALLSILGWAWTWSSSLQGLISEVARALFLATHG